MRVTDILRAKGSTVATIAPDATLGELEEERRALHDYISTGR
jgi:hypothetical protein